MKRYLLWFGAFFLGLWLTACNTPRNVFVLLPAEDGSSGEITVSNEKGTQALSEPWMATGMNRAGQAPITPKQIDPAAVKAIFKDALAAQPLPPKHFILNFKAGSSELTEDSQKLIPDVLQTIQERQSVDTSVIGHTDTSGAASYNLQLSRQRAAVIGQILTTRGVDPDILDISSHGEGNLLVPTGDNVFEPRNRRVEITVR
jgi:outer membrane protein OmpA-like peptidoglycan-associated protein